MGGVWRFLQKPALRAWPSTPGDRATLTRMKEGAGHAKQEDDTDAERREREMRNTQQKSRTKGKQGKAEWRKGKGRTRRGKAK
jgi:hypothetical protein